jgi:molybdopterin synthase catalytic subunit
MTDSVTIRVLFFGQLKDVAGVPETELVAPDGATAAWVFGHYAALHPPLEALRKSIVIAVNQEFAAPDAPLREGDEVAFLPPVSGGEDPWTHLIEDPAGHFFALTRLPIDSAALAARLRRDSDGAIVVFDGVVRNETGGRPTERLDYEGYEPMALKVIAEIGREMAARHAIGRIGVIHRLGPLEIGETSVTVAVASPHRAAAFDAAREAMDLLKRRVPIWKKERFADGEVWVEGAWDASLPRP